MDSAPAIGSTEVLLATYNGEHYLPAQLDSLFAQSFSDFTVVVSDDGSTDGTLAVVADYAGRYPGRIRVLPQQPDRLGASANFSRLLDHSRSDYVFFCDQDDVWRHDKMARSLDRMAQLVRNHPPAMPLLVHTDLTVVDRDLKVVGKSFFRFSRIDPARNGIGALMLGNIATGCTLLANRALCDTARPIPPNAMMFDYWLAQVAATTGKLDCIREQTVLYRQHGGNLIGARRAGTTGLLARAKATLFTDRTLRVLASFSRQAQALLERYDDRLSPQDRVKVRAMAELWTRPRHVRLASLLRAGLRKSTLPANIALALLVLRNPQPERR